MAQRFWSTAIIGGGYVLLGVGLTHYGLKYSKESHLFNNCLCEPQNSSSVAEKPLKSYNEDTYTSSHQNKLENGVLLEKAASLIKQFKEESGSPGLAVSVSVNGQTIWSEGFGYSDVENDVPCTPNTVMRIASISKPLTATAAMKLVEEGKLKLDDPVQKYVPSFPEKQVNSKPCIITVRHLLSHLSGIRHYHSNNQGEKNTSTNENKDSDRNKETIASKFEKEFYIKECYGSVEKSLSLFKDDPLAHEPGSQYLYSTFGYTLLSAVIENASQTKFLLYMHRLFKDLGMSNTQAELHKKLVYGRARHYERGKTGQLINTPYVDNCYKWAGGGFLSTSEDLMKFGNAMLYASQVEEYREKKADNFLPGIVSPESMKLLWTIAENTEDKLGKGWGYGLGWALLPQKQEHGCCKEQQNTITHSGGAVGGSSILLIQPCPVKKNTQLAPQDIQLPPCGVVVVILVNMQRVSLRKPALEIAKLFNNIQKQ